MVNILTYLRPARGRRRKIKKAIEILRSKNIRPSMARIKILEYLTGTTDHPTVEMIYSRLLPEIPTLSKTTVYKTLELLVEANLARLLHMDENEARFDANVSDHGHFRCSRCGKVYDFEADLDSLETKGLGGFAVAEKNLIFKGSCPRCRTD